MHFHWQNLNEEGHHKGSPIRHGRAWLGPFEWEWLIWKHPHLGFDVDLATHEHALGVSVHLVLFSLYLLYENFKLSNWLQNAMKRKDQKYGSGRSIGIDFRDWTLHVQLWSDPIEWRSKDPWWWAFHVNLPDRLFGSARYLSHPLTTERVIVPMPEGGYPATVQINEDRWKRPRLPWARTLVRAELTPDKEFSPLPGCGMGLTAGKMHCIAYTGLTIPHSKPRWPLRKQS